MARGSRLEARGWTLEARGSRLEAGRSRLEARVPGHLALLERVFVVLAGGAPGSTPAVRPGSGNRLGSGFPRWFRKKH